MKKIFSAIIILFGITANLYSQTYSNDELKILKLQDRRTTGENNELSGFLSSPDLKTVKKALVALANISDTTTVSIISDVLRNNSDTEIRKTAAYALGQISCSSSLNSLITYLKSNPEDEIYPDIIEAIGYQGGAEDILFVIEKNYKSDKSKSALALCIARSARRNIKFQKAVDYLCQLYANKDGETERLISYAFNNYRNSDLLTTAVETIRYLTKSENYETRMWAFNALGYAGNTEDLKYSIESYHRETEWQVKVNILNSIVNYLKNSSNKVDYNFLSGFLTEQFVNNNIHLITTAINVTGIVFSNEEADKESVSKTSEALKNTFFVQDYPNKKVKGEAYLAYASLVKDNSKNFLINEYKRSDYDLKPFIIRGFGKFNNGSVFNEILAIIKEDVQTYNRAHNITSGEMISDNTLRELYRAFIDMMSSLKEKITIEDEKVYARLIFLEFSGSKDAAIVDACFESLNSEMFSIYRDEFIKVMEVDFNDFKYPEDKEVMILFLKQFIKLKASNSFDVFSKAAKTEDYEIRKICSDAYKTLFGKPFEYEIKPRYINIEQIPEATKNSYAILETNKGNIKIKLLPEYAPFTVLNFTKLSKDGFYNNTVFHRVVSNFVIQGGDPRGTGWGGPSYTIRTEIAYIHYERGMVGMASDGKDTEGSQFFITHSPFYHLDNRYTIFAQVVKGMEVVDNVFIGDTLKRVVLQ